MKYRLLPALAFLTSVAAAQILQLPPRPASAPGGNAFAQTITPLSRDDRENAIYAQIAAGNIPQFMRSLVRVAATANVGGANYTVVYWTTPDYLCVGSDSDYFYTPMTPLLAQRIATLTGCSMPTRKMVNDIYASATVKLAPLPIPPSAEMITVPVFKRHSDTVHLQRDPILAAHPLGELVGGTKKDVIISNYIYNNLKTNVPKPVVIYGWHYLSGTPIQPLYNGHEETYADYSHGIRLIQKAVTVNDSTRTIAQILADPALNVLLSDEGAIIKPAYSMASIQISSPKSFGLLRESSTSLRVAISGANDTTIFTAYLGTDGISFPDSAVLDRTAPRITGLIPNTPYYVRLRTFTPSGTSAFSEVLAATPTAEQTAMLIVNGFDRASTGNTYNFIRQHGHGAAAAGRAFASCTNDAILEGLVSLRPFPVVDYILGDESTANETFSTAEQESVKVYLRGGGRLLVSGSEIAWDLDYKGSTTDKDFYHSFLKAVYVRDAPGSAGTLYSAAAAPGSIFDGLGPLTFDNGTHGTINVQYPDAISTTEGTACLTYPGYTDVVAGIQYTGTFPGGTAEGRLVNLGIPFETFYPQSTVDELMRRVLIFFGQVSGVAANADAGPASYVLSPNFPNPFNPSTTIRFSLPERSFVRLQVHDVLGREIESLYSCSLAAGTHSAVFKSRGLASGTYYYTLTAFDPAAPSAVAFRQTRACVLVK